MVQISFSVLQDLDPGRMLIVDTSIYGDEKIPFSPTLEVKFPDFKKIYKTEIEYSNINILNTARLGYTDCAIDFPDGIYELKYTASNCSATQTIFRTVKAWNRLNILLQNADYNNKYLLNTFNKINLYLHGAESMVDVNQYQAQQLYKQAINLLNCNTDGMQLLKEQSNICKS